MATGPKIVHKQFNSPIGLYSQQNIKETLGKHMQNLDNGTVGIDFQNPTTDKPANLANSAVLRMLEEEERTRKGYPSQKKVVWPPAPETNGYHQPQNQQAPAYYNNAQQPPSAQVQQSPQYQPPNQQYQAPSQQYQAPNQQYQAPNQQYQAPNQQYQAPHQQYQVPIQQYQAPNQQYQAPNQQYQTPQEPGHCEGRRQEGTGLSKLIPVGPGVTASPVSPQYRPAPQPPRVDVGQHPSSRWAPVQSPLSPQGYGQQPQYSPQSQQYSPQSQQFSPQSQQFSPQSQQQAFSPQPQQYSSQPHYQAPQFEPPPSTITLRPQPPVHQQPPPVFASQPATATFKGGVNMRGDIKWPPQSVKEAVEAENEARRQLAKGPACRPRKVRKDYTRFFAQHALNHNYPGYKAPPGTQHYDDHPGQSIY